MPRQKGVTQLETLRRRQAEIAEQLKLAEARERDREKQNDAKRRDLLGSVILENLRTDPEGVLAQSVIFLLDGKLTRPAERALFPALGSAIATASTAHPQPEPPLADEDKNPPSDASS